MNSKNVSILVVEDNPTERKLVSAFLQKRGYQVKESANGLEALDSIRSSRPDIILSDLAMPKLGGLELLEAVNEEFGEIPFIIISGVGTLNDVVFGLRQGAWDYLSKPLHPIELLQVSIDKVLEKLQLIRESKRINRELEELVHDRTINLIKQNLAYEEEIQRRQEQEQKAQNAVNEWRSTVNALPEMISIVDEDRRIRRLNKPMLELLGKSEEELQGTTCSLCERSGECILDKVIADNTPQKTRTYLKEKDIHLELEVIPYTSADKSFLGSIHVFRDITQQKNDEQEKEQLHATLLHAQKLESVGQLAAGIAHEINTPSQFTSANIAFLSDAFSDIEACFNKLLKLSESGPIEYSELQSILEEHDWDYLRDETASAINQSQEGLNRITTIVRAMKEFSHPGNRVLERTDINHIIEVTVTVARNEWKYAANLHLDLTPNLPQVSCLSDELGQVILNLLVNAAHAIEDAVGRTPEHGKGNISISTSLSGSSVFITIKDDGNGIPQKIQDKIFDPFFTTKAVGKGTGQGLAIAYDVITNKHKGNLSFTSRAGEGTCFTIQLPVGK